MLHRRLEDLPESNSTQNDMPKTVQHREFLDKCEAMKAEGLSDETVQSFIHKMTHLKLSDIHKFQSLIVETLQQVSALNISTIGPLCLGSFTRALELLTSEHITDKSDDLPMNVRQQTLKSFFTALGSFVTSYKSDDRMESIEDRWLRCDCDTTDPLVYKLHIYSPATYAGLNVWRGPVQSMVLELYRIIRFLTNGERKKPETPRPADIFRCDATEAVAAAVQWLKHTTIPSAIFEILASYCHFIPGFEFQQAILDNRYILEAGAVHFDQMVLGLEHPNGQTFGLEAYPDTNKGYIDTSLVTLTPGFGGVKSSLKFFQEIMVTRMPPTRQMIIPLIPVAQRIYDICLRLLRIFPLKPVNPFHEGAMAIGRVAYDYIPKATRPPRLDPSIPTIYVWIHESLVNLTNLKRCMNPGCKNEESLQQCGRCRLILYCGAECQGKAWKMGNTPHNRLCKILQPYAMLFNVDGNIVAREDFEDSARAAGLHWIEATILLKTLHNLQKSLGIDY